MKDKRPASSCRAIPTVALKEEQDERERLVEVAETGKGEGCPVDISARRPTRSWVNAQWRSYSNRKAEVGGIEDG